MRQCVGSIFYDAVFKMAADAGGVKINFTLESRAIARLKDNLM